VATEALPPGAGDNRAAIGCLAPAWEPVQERSRSNRPAWMYSGRRVVLIEDVLTSAPLTGGGSLRGGRYCAPKRRQVDVWCSPGVWDTHNAPYNGRISDNRARMTASENNTPVRAAAIARRQIAVSAEAAFTDRLETDAAYREQMFQRAGVGTTFRQISSASLCRRRDELYRSNAGRQARGMLADERVGAMSTIKPLRRHGADGAPPSAEPSLARASGDPTRPRRQGATT